MHFGTVSFYTHFPGVALECIRPPAKRVWLGSVGYLVYLSPVGPVNKSGLWAVEAVTKLFLLGTFEVSHQVDAIFLRKIEGSRGTGQGNQNDGK
ncbi:hypothetical protein LLE49_20800 [Alicyclobacillus tolerans]|uniref:hypothetical protein n=1 Tax=Alicyclobacillus tolerans TaxID=90970 RepID=UPI001F250E0B|nr:hypothetical protein [Alicyclobacillus tolerans]MCF8567162.1 hypothetical protein [Alicyclobacillus tolerans]